jgi:hypothetical protein
MRVFLAGATGVTASVSFRCLRARATTWRSDLEAGRSHRTAPANTELRQHSVTRALSPS